MSGKKRRLCDSNMSVSAIQEALQGWFADRQTRSVEHLLAKVSTWVPSTMPQPDDLAHPDIVSLMLQLAKGDATLHPKRKYVELALKAEHHSSALFLQSLTVEQSIVRASKTILLAASKYRELSMYPERWSPIAEKAIIPESMGATSHPPSIRPFSSTPNQIFLPR